MARVALSEEEVAVTAATRALGVLSEVGVGLETGLGVDNGVLVRAQWVEHPAGAARVASGAWPSPIPCLTTAQPVLQGSSAWPCLAIPNLARDVPR